MAERELGAAVRPVQREDHKLNNQPHTVTFADFVEKLLDEKYSPEEKAQLNKIFLAREETLKPRRKDAQSESRAILSILADDYEQFIFDIMKRKMEERSNEHLQVKTKAWYLVRR